jgi:global nitrogen regulator NtcA
MQDRPLAAVFRQIGGSSFPPVIETFERGKTIFFPGDPAERVYFLMKGAVKLSRVYEAGEEITVALLRENSVFGVLSLITGHRSDRFYHAVAFTPVELLSAPIDQVEQALKDNPELSMLMLQGLSSRILQTEMMIETLAHRDMGSRLVSFLLILCRDFGVPGKDGITIDLKLSHQAIRGSDWLHTSNRHSSTGGFANGSNDFYSKEKNHGSQPCSAESAVHVGVVDNLLIAQVHQF